MRNKYYLTGFIAIVIMLAPFVYSASNFVVEIPQSHQDVQPGESVYFTMKMLNLENSKRVDVIVDYEILDSNKNSIAKKTETVAVETQIALVRNLGIPKNSALGYYSVHAKITFADGTSSEATSSFKVVKNLADTWQVSLLFAVIALIILLFIIFLIIKSKKILERINMRKKIHKIVNERMKY
jgi:hypothetical protein